MFNPYLSIVNCCIAGQAHAHRSGQRGADARRENPLTCDVVAGKQVAVVIAVGPSSEISDTSTPPLLLFSNFLSPSALWRLATDHTPSRPLPLSGDLGHSLALSTALLAASVSTMGHSLGGLKPTFEPPLMRVPADLRNDEDIADSASRPPPKPGSSCSPSAYPLGGRWWSLVNSAGIAESNIPAEKYAGQAFRKTIDVNLIGAFVPQRWKYRGRPGITESNIPAETYDGQAFRKTVDVASGLASLAAWLSWPSPALPTRMASAHRSSHSNGDVMSREPSILYIMADQLAAPQLKIYNEDPQIKTPNLDKLAERSVVFDSAYCTSPLRAPSRMAMITGQPPSEIGAYDNASPRLKTHHEGSVSAEWYDGKAFGRTIDVASAPP
ncbi:unnamed protein product [Zymoseptoria tritici ST99CH_3D7]|uniref:Sulfatase N-terminal domain-containing protein n=2 Tax=Zymoseptoria tritici TaxID=1047171 RepID=A0A1X7RDG1_ZYMT9|nr:unnamed protein product [Zymoseptoria tritici ST99CH_3D7]